MQVLREEVRALHSNDLKQVTKIILQILLSWVQVALVHAGYLILPVEVLVSCTENYRLGMKLGLKSGMGNISPWVYN